MYHYYHYYYYQCLAKSTIILQPGVLNQGPPGWESRVLSTEPGQLHSVEELCKSHFHIKLFIRAKQEQVLLNEVGRGPTSWALRGLSGKYQGCESSRILSDFRLFCSSQNPIFRHLMHWKAHLFRHCRLFKTFSHRRSHVHPWIASLVVYMAPLHPVTGSTLLLLEGCHFIHPVETMCIPWLPCRPRKLPRDSHVPFHFAKVTLRGFYRQLYMKVSLQPWTLKW